MEDSNDKKVVRSVTNKIDVLPDSVLYQILSFLDMKEVIATSLVSRRWRYLWESVSVLNFVHKEQRPENAEDSRNGFMNFVDRVLLLRDGSKVNKFKISGACVDSDRLQTWLTVAARRQFQEVHIDMYANGLIELPDLLISSAITVFSLVVDTNRSVARPVKYPGSFSSSPQLKTLILDNVVLPNGSNGELMFSCPVLENLTLKYCYQSHLSALVIFTPQLKSLKILDADVRDDNLFHTKIWTPMLISLKWTCSWDSCYSFGNLSNLVYAKIVCLDCGSVANAQNLVKVFDAISCATTVKLELEVHKNMPDKLFGQFSNVRHLRICQWGDNSSSILVLKMLKNAPSLVTLVVKAEMEDFDEDVSPFMLCHLKSVKMLCNLKSVKAGMVTKVKFLKVLLRSSTGLEKLVIEMPGESSTQEKLSLRKKIHSLAGASPGLKVVVSYSSMYRPG